MWFFSHKNAKKQCCEIIIAISSTLDKLYFLFSLFRLISLIIFITAWTVRFDRNFAYEYTVPEFMEKDSFAAIHYCGLRWFVRITKIYHITYIYVVWNLSSFGGKIRQMNIQLVRENLDYKKSARYAPLSSLQTA